MNEDQTKSVVDNTDLDTKIAELANQVVAESDPAKSKQLVELFNWYISKKNTARVVKLNELYDDVTDQMVLRFKTRADQFSNSDVLDYMKAVQGAIDTSTKNLTQVEEPPKILQQNNTQINVNIGDTFDREAKQRILEAVQQTLKQAQTIVQETPQETENIVYVDPESAIEELNSVTEENK